MASFKRVMSNQSVRKIITASYALLAILIFVGIPGTAFSMDKNKLWQPSAGLIKTGNQKQIMKKVAV